MLQLKKRLNIRLGLLLILSLFSASLHQVDAQSTSTPRKDYTNKYKWEASLDILNLFKTGNTGLLMRYSPNDKGAIRVGVGLDVANTKFRAAQSPAGTPTLLYTQKSTTFSLRTGYEFHKNLQKHQLYYGSDARISNTRTNPVFESTYSGPQFGGNGSLALALEPFIGVKYFVLENLSLSAESHLVGMYQNIKTYSIDEPGKVVGTVKSTSLRYYGIYQIFLSYHF